MNCNRYFDWLFSLGEICIFLDGITVYTVNHLKQIPSFVNVIAHLGFLLTLQGFVFVHFLYWLDVTDSQPKKTWKKIGYCIPFFMSVLITIVFIPELQYRIGDFTNYSMGVSAIASYVSIGLYAFLALVIFKIKKNYIQANKRTGFTMAISAVLVIVIIQMIYNEILISSVAVALVIVSLYLCMENPSIKYQEFYHGEMVMGFATLVESKDGSTGGHIQRSSSYAVLIANALRKTQKYKDYITKDIIKKTFGHLDDEKYENMAYKIALSHHEKWNGKGYPFQLKEIETPLCARIMAVADVFDAVSAKRCYRDALPLEVCFQIIRDGRGEDFDPNVVDAFFSEQERVEEIYQSVVIGNQ